MSFKHKKNGKWYNGNGEEINNPNAYACAIYGQPYKDMWDGTPNTCDDKIDCGCGCSNQNSEVNDDYDEPIGPTADEEAQSLGYADYNDYCDEYWEGHTGGELGEPSYPEIDDHNEVDDYNTDCDESIEIHTEDYCEGFADGYSEGYDDGYDDGWSDCNESFDSYSDCDW